MKSRTPRDSQLARTLRRVGREGKGPKRSLSEYTSLVSVFIALVTVLSSAYFNKIQADRETNRIAAEQLKNTRDQYKSVLSEAAAKCASVASSIEEAEYFANVYSSQANDFIEGRSFTPVDFKSLKDFFMIVKAKAKSAEDNMQAFTSWLARSGIFLPSRQLEQLIEAFRDFCDKSVVNVGIHVTECEFAVRNLVQTDLATEVQLFARHESKRSVGDPLLKAAMADFKRLTKKLKGTDLSSYLSLREVLRTQAVAPGSSLPEHL